MIIYGYCLFVMFLLILWGLLWEIVGCVDVIFFVLLFFEVIVMLFLVIGIMLFLKVLFEIFYVFVVGVFLVIVIGILVGILMGKNWLIDELFLFWVNMFFSVLFMVLVLVLMVLFGFGM